MDQKETTQGTTAQAAVRQTTLNHPTLPQNISLVERIVLPTVFALVMNLSKNPEQRANLQGYFEPLRDALNAAYPPDQTDAATQVGANF